MDVDDPQSPIMASDDTVLSGAGESGVEAEMSTLRVDSTPERPVNDEGETSGKDTSWCPSPFFASRRPPGKE